ncbi:MAG: winged helix-turn-helix transcriptional regulator [Clostridia bacterium]|nr:winged helix-turn-helix transcriptional regulator [Clostridia bacterium]
MADFTPEELRAKILEYLQTKDKAKNRDIATAIGANKKDVDKMVNALANEGLVEFLYLGTSYVTLKK